MNGLTSTGWAKMGLSVWPSQSAGPPKTVGHSRKACTRHIEISKQLRRLPLIVLASLALAPAAVAEEDEKAYPGAACQTKNFTDSIERDEDGRMFNMGSEDQTWICPVVKDVAGGDDPEFARISVISGSGRVECSFRSRNENGGGIVSASPDQVSTSNNVTLLRYGDDNPDIPAGVTSGYFYFLCSIPGRPNADSAASGVVTYVVTEQD